MSFDGSFRVDYELQRFLTRCPELASLSQFDYLLNKGDKVTEEEVVNAVGEIVIHPKYTIPLIGCFCPLARRIVDRAVSLLSLVPNLRCNNDEGEDLMEVDQEDDRGEVEDLDIEDTIHIIDVYAKRGKGLKLHELACLAFCRAYDLVRSLLRPVLGYFEFAPPPFERIRQRKSVIEAVVLDGGGLLNAIRVSYRLLLAEPEVFSTMWDWSCLLDNINQFHDFYLGKNEEPNRCAHDIIWCGIRILSILLKLNDRAIANFNLCSQEACSCLLRWEEYCQDVALEKAAWYLESPRESNCDSTGGSMGYNQCRSLQSSPFDSSVPSSTILENGLLKSGDKKVTWDCGKPFILTSAMQKGYEMVFLAFSQRWPVLLYGPAGAGKTALISKLAELHGGRVLFLHMDEQVDGKMLVGTYVCTEQPGEFRWQPGSLTQAVSNGFWVVFEDVDKAPPDVQCILLPLLEGATSFFTGHGEGIQVHEGFRLFSTMTSTKLDISMEGKSSVSALWRRVMIAPSSHQDLLKIVNKWYPELESLAAELIGTFDRVNELVGCHFGNGAFLGSHGRFSLRDLLKWCKRIAGLGFHFGGDGLSAYARENIYKEAVDIFAAFSTAEKRLAVVKEIAKMWSVGSVETLYPINRPVIQELASELRIGRVVLKLNHRVTWEEKKRFVEIRNLIHVLERIACSVKYNEPVLLVGETGTGKTTLVQSLASRLGQKLTVLNLSQQSDIADLLGGFKPIDAQFICIPLYKEFENLFTTTFSSKENGDFLVRLRKFVSEKNWKMLLGGFQKGVRKIIEIGRSGSGTKRKRPLGDELIKAWETFSLKLDKARMQIGATGGMIFSFVEGAFISALKNGEWILLDEVNLAPPETLQRVIGVLEEETGSLCLTERGDVDYVNRHPNFRIFACMNPATDAGKRDLPVSLRCRFTEYFVDDLLDDEDLSLFISQFIDEDHSNRELVSKIVQFYKAAKKQSDDKLQDGANQKPQYSLRSLYRALEYTKKAKRTFGLAKALYDGFCMFFLIALDVPSAKLMNQLITVYLLEGKIPPQISFDAYLLDRGNSVSDDLTQSYVLTKSVKEHIRNLARAIFVGRYPVLLQGPTSSGKTSLVQYLAAITGHEFVRINNHEHTDLQEYLGSYVTDANGKLVFHEGALVKAVRNGHWIVLDELNLAPSDVLEALNRLLDDNRELFVPELCETVRAHPNFMLFATQNPPTLYGGRKILSRAFRNRFVEIHVDEIPEDELSTILTNRCEIPESYSRKMIAVMKGLQLHRQSTKIFAGKHGFITPRDLFRWANRFREFGKSYEDLARDGYYLMAERLRDNDEKKVVQAVLEQQLRVRLAEDDMYKQEGGGRDKILEVIKHSGVAGQLNKIVWTRSMWRLYFLVERCYKLREPVLLVGETGGGKTTVCQLLSIILGSKLHILNCHQYTETSDFLGGFYPVRERSKISTDFKHLCEKLMHSKAIVNYPGDSVISSDINHASSTLHKLSVILSNYRQSLVCHPDVTSQDVDYIGQLNLDLVQLCQKWQTIFMWQDGPLVEAMKKGELFLVDEISLADDSVLERLNSVLEPERKLSLAEKGGSDLQKITAHPNFFLLATMNPGGDFGKKELSPALRNRFTEIWVPPITELDELNSIALESISNTSFSVLVDLMMKFWEWFNNLQTGRALTVRDLLSWVSFINVTERILQPESAFLHGAFLVLLDGLSLGTNISRTDAAGLREKCLSFLLDGLKELNLSFDCSNISMLVPYGWADPGRSAVIECSDTMQCDNRFGIPPFYIEKGGNCFAGEKFEFLAPTTRRNALRVLRAMQLAKPVLLEGSPGVGKTSLIVALGKFSGHTVVRINLSEQTDIMDLFGSDLPVEGDEGMQFAWSDGILLQALKQGSWVLLDELNLASQSVLEGLNAILDHRAEVFIPELGRTFKCPPSFRVFACQNPSNQGGGRKGLPKSFLNRFMKVYVDELVEDDYLAISSSLYPTISRSLLSNLVLFNKRLHEEIMLLHRFAQEGSPWEFNLRDVIRSCEIIKDAPSISESDCFLNPVYVQRMRTAVDRVEVLKLYEQVFKMKPSINPHPRVQLNPQYLIVGNVSIERNRYLSPGVSNSDLKILPGFRNSLEAVAQCVKNQWLCILVGPASSGKTSLIRLLAQLTGNVLNELNLSSATDISELLGSFEQHNAVRKFRLAIAWIESFINEYCGLQLESSCKEFMMRKELFILWLSFLSSIKHDPPTSSCSSYVDTWRTKYFESASTLVNIIEHLKLVVEETSLPLSWSMKDLDTTLAMIKKFEEGHSKRTHSSKFEWVTGMLVKAIENGEWIVLDNANLCNPTVLDRINSLVEQSGSITINECGTVEGKPVILHPHPKFRMFLTVNPLNGEVSRAMRNRGVEIFMMEPDWLFDDKCTEIDIELENAKRYIVLSGVPSGNLVDLMANAHMNAKVEGALLKIRITLLELARWVQLFQQLLTNGNQFSWSLQTSWQHTYVSLFGVDGGKSIVDQVGVPISLIPKFQDFNSSQAGLLSMPGGWPAPLKLRDYLIYSKETCIRQNCMYLEFLGAQTACYSTSAALRNALAPTSMVSSLVMDTRLLHALMFPKNSSCQAYVCDGAKELNLDLAREMLLYAANWVFEQATESDYKLYLLWFSHVGSLLQQHSSFFSFYSSILAKELEHPIWNQIFSCRREIVSHYLVNLDTCPIPLLSVELVDLMPADNLLKSCTVLVNAIKSVRLLRLSHLQWSSEIGYKYSSETQFFKPVLRSLQELEKNILEMFVQSPSFDVLFQLYSNLLEHHTLLWTGIITSQNECLLISWRSLMKEVSRLSGFFPKEVETFQRDVESLDKFSKKWPSQLQKSLLWVHGGHPYLPPSAELYEKLCQLLNFCERLWPGKRKIRELATDDVITEAAPYSNPELRLLAMQGLSMSSYVMAKVDENGIRPVEQLEEMYQMLSRRFGFEKEKLEENFRSINQAPRTSILPACCVFLPDMFCQSSSFDCWLETLPIADDASFFLDTRLLQNLSTFTLTDGEEQRQNLSPIALTDGEEQRQALAGLIKSAMDFSLNFSSRPPTDFSPHQKILWTLDAWRSTDRASEQISSFVLEMWYIWHLSLWTPTVAENLSWHKCDDILPDELFKPSKMAAIQKILFGTFAIRDYPVHSLKMRAASRYLWQGSLEVDTKHFLLSTARSLFQKMIFAHRKSFEDEKFDEIKDFFEVAAKKTISQDKIETMLSLLASSNHKMISSDEMTHFVEPLLQGLYLPCTPEAFTNRIGSVWLLIGAFRYQLLICCTDLDPTAKYYLKYSRVVEKISSLHLEAQVRNDCVLLAGSFQLREQERDRSMLLEDLHAERKKLQRKIVFRAEPEKFKRMKAECDDFLGTVDKIVTTTLGWTQNFKSISVEEISGKVRNWQETATKAIKQLSKEYSSYMDVIQPVQTAIYEIKLGLSLAFSGALSEKYLEELGKFDMESVLAAVYAFVKFPRGCASKSVSFDAVNNGVELLHYDIEFPTSISALDLNLLDNLVNCKQRVSADSKVSSLQLRTAMYQNVLVRVLHSVVDAHFMDTPSFKLTDRIFDELASNWMQMKLQVRTTEENKAQQFRFKPRLFKIDNILEIDISALGSSASNESFSEWKEFHSRQEYSEKQNSDEEPEAIMDDWNYIEDSSLNNIIHVHNELFGSTDIYQSPGCFHVSDASRLSSFTDSYLLGAKMIRDLEGLPSSSLDAKIAPEHLLHLCLEHETKFCSSNKSTLGYNFYKEPNFSMLAKMVDPLVSLKQRITLLLEERDEYALQRILDIIEMILAMPLSTPLAKALSSLEFLLSRVRMLQETVAKFPLSDFLDPIFALVCSWYKLEFESCPALLNEVEDQFEKNAGKLWLPLYSVLRREQCADTDEYNLTTIRSLKEFIEMSSIGEFKKRLQLLVAFHGHICAGLRNGTYSSLCLEESVKILYNSFGFYAQFLPMILEHIGTNRRKIEAEVNELVKLCRWERFEDYLSIESSRRTRQKLRKIMQKYTDLLQQPVMLLINQEARRSGINPQSTDEPSLLDSFERSRALLNIVLDQKQSKMDSPSWFSDWWKKVENAVQGLHLDVSTDTDLSRLVEGVANVIKDGQGFKSSCLLYLDEWKQLRQTIEDVCGTAIDCVDVWVDASKKMGKRRVFSDFLKLLDSCGLSKHRALFMEEQWRVNILMCWFLQPSYDVQHLLLTQGPPASKDSEVSRGELQCSLDESLETKWKTANLYYFKSINSVHVLQQICLNFHKDFTLEQVNKSGSYIDHLTSIQQEQREVVYAFSQRLKCLKELLLPLASLSSGNIPFTNATCDQSFTENQHCIYKCLWQQKQLFDNLYGMLYEEHLFVQTVEDFHLNTCPSVKDSAMQIRLFIENHLPIVQESKDLLDSYLIGIHGVGRKEETPLHPIAITKDMKQLVYKNFDLINDFKVDFRAFHGQDEVGVTVKDIVLGNSIKDILLGNFEEIFDKTNFIHNQFKSRSTSEERAQDFIHYTGDTTALQAEFDNALVKTYRSIIETLKGLVTLKNGRAPPDGVNINALKILLESATRHLQSDLSDQLVNTIHLGGELLNRYSAGNANAYSDVRAHVENMYSLLDVIIAFGDGLLHDFLIMHRMLSMMTHVLANIFASLFAKGFGTKEEDTDDANQDLIQDQSGTGMGEGSGMNDVSDQINDEDQLIGTSADRDEENTLGDAPSKTDKGIEMEQDFVADTFSVSEDSGDDEDGNEENEELESAMGETGNQGEAVDEKLWDKGEDNPSTADEKYENGPSVRDSGIDRELRAKDDSSEAADEAGGLDLDKSEEQADENGNDETCEGMEDINMDKEDAYADPTGLKLDEHEEGPEDDCNMDEPETAEPMMEDDLDQQGNPADENEGDERADSDATFDEADPEHLEESSGGAGEEGDPANDTKKEPTTENREMLQSDTSQSVSDNVPTAASEPRGEYNQANLKDAAPEAKGSDVSGLQHDLAPMRGFPDASMVEIMASDSSNGQKLGSDQPENPLPPADSSHQRIQPNPCRSVGDALEGWKDRVKVSLDLQESEAPDDLAAENANEYSYTAEFEKGTAQALGPATADQVDKNVHGNDLERETVTTERKDDISEMEIETEAHTISNSALSFSNDKGKGSEMMNTEEQLESPSEVDTRDGTAVPSLSQSLVSVNRTFLSEDINRLSELSVDDDDLGKAHNLEEVSNEMRESATTLWKNYELRTTRLSQELAEQLRLVMEPTLASKLQGDYKTGKRINMKKVIPYIASHYRKDKIWLRRTRPNKRNYQVVIAVDDSRSMSESGCGSLAIEALVTVCRAMSQLEIGQLSVASFGKKGNIRVLHDFDQSFTGEAGIKMISSLTFKQENTIAEEPMVDLLKYLNDMLDAAAANARLPSGHNPLEQLVLIIADGWFHEKENMKRYVRDLLSKKRMVAFLVVDSLQKSILDLEEATFQGGDVKLSKYLDSFPFPYYVVLKNIEALPRTLADLLRQWFELMQHSRE
ncbi:midasin isoform X1 [Solanum stenotomum]|uniref:midasin isoform X1 n=1 Tax=Solanum stenotomum TaxID=172797 RepID=UPI0020D02086|nr:midasin isoform X1 [Solanum stenotomum]